MMLTKNIEQLKIEVAEHMKTDRAVKDYWDNYRCCFTDSFDPSEVTDRFNVPIELVVLCEHLYQSAPREQAEKLFARFSQAIGIDGKDLTRVVWKFTATELRRFPDQPPKDQNLIDSVIEDLDLLAKGKKRPVNKYQREIMKKNNVMLATRFALRMIKKREKKYVKNLAAVSNVVNGFGAEIRQMETLLRLIKEAPVVSDERKESQNDTP